MRQPALATQQSQTGFTYDNFHVRFDTDSDKLLISAFKEYFTALQKQIEVFKKWIETSKSVQAVFDQTVDLFNYDDWTVHEYEGLGEILAAQDYNQIYEIMETSVNMGNEVGCLILEKMRDEYAEYYGRLDVRENSALTLCKTL